jgi:hypothetical protein
LRLRQNRSIKILSSPVFPVHTDLNISFLNFIAFYFDK